MNASDLPQQDNPTASTASRPSWAADLAELRTAAATAAGNPFLPRDLRAALPALVRVLDAQGAEIAAQAERCSRCACRSEGL